MAAGSGPMRHWWQKRPGLALYAGWAGIAGLLLALRGAWVAGGF